MKLTIRRIKKDGAGQATECAFILEAKKLTSQLKRIARGSFWNGYIFQDGSKVCWGGDPLTLTMRMCIKGEL